jgi:tripeptidyl-peptidase-1
MFSRIGLKLCILLSLLLQALAAVHEQLAAAPDGWTVTEPLSSTTEIKLSVSLIHQNIGQLESRLFAASTPSGASYGKHLDLNDTVQLFGPTTESKSAVISWLQRGGIASIYTNDFSIDFITSVGKINNLLNTTFTNYENNGVQKIRTTQYSIPDNLTQHIDLISPTVYFGNSASLVKKDKRIVSRDHVDASCYNAITPPCLKEMYSVGSYQSAISSGSRVAFGSFLNRSAIYSDLSDFEQMFNITEQGFSVETIDGGTSDQNASITLIGEPNLDVQSIIGISHPLPVTEYITGGLP